MLQSCFTCPEDLFAAILLLVIFIIHDLEEVLSMRRWMTSHASTIRSRFPRLAPRFEPLLRTTTRAFAIAVAEELVVLAVFVLMASAGHRWALFAVASLFIAFTVHFFVHVAQAVAMRGYVPGLVSALLFVVPSVLVSLCEVHFLCETTNHATLWILGGVVFMVVNLRFAHWLGRRLGGAEK